MDGVSAGMDDLPANSSANAEAQRTNTLLEEINKNVKAFSESVTDNTTILQDVSRRVVNLETDMNHEVKPILRGIAP